MTFGTPESIVFAAATMGGVREGIDFFPLQVEYEERMSAGGKIPGSFFRREGRPSTDAILTARLTDRPLRPLFPEGMRNEVQVIMYSLSADTDNPLDMLAINAASAAIMISDIPWNGPVGAVRVGRVDGQFIADPTYAEIASSDLDLRIAGTKITLATLGADDRLGFRTGDWVELLDDALELESQPGQLLQVVDFSEAERTLTVSGTALDYGQAGFEFDLEIYEGAGAYSSAITLLNNQQLIGILAGSLDLITGGFLADIRNTKIGKSGYLYLYSTDRTIIMHPDRSRLMKKDVPPGVNKMFDRAIEGFEGTGENVNSRGLRSISSFKRSADPLSTRAWI